MFSKKDFKGCDSYCVNCYQARKFDVRRAVALYEAHEITRFRENLARYIISEHMLSTHSNFCEQIRPEFRTPENRAEYWEIHSSRQ